MPIIGLVAKAQSGKDTVAQMIIDEANNGRTSNRPAHWEIKKFAGKLKQIVALLTGCKVEDLEKEEFKNSELPEAWTKYELLNWGKPTGTIYSHNPDSPESNSQHQYTVERRPWTYRRLLQVLGTEGLRDLIHQNVHVNALMADYHPNESSWIVTDVRFPNEADAIRNAGGVLVKVERPGLSTGTHPSETALDDYKNWDYVIDNRYDLPYLRRQVNDIYGDIKKLL